MSARVFALDLGTATGYAAGIRGGPWSWGVYDFAPRRLEGQGMRYLRARHVFQEAFKLWEPTAVIFEAVGFVKHSQAAEVRHGLQAILLSECDAAGYPYHGVPVATLKRYATGTGNAGKGEWAPVNGKPTMLASLYDRWHGVVPGAPRPSTLTHDEGDAIWLLAYGLDRLVPEGVEP